MEGFAVLLTIDLLVFSRVMAFFVSEKIRYQTHSSAHGSDRQEGSWGLPVLPRKCRTACR